MYSFEVFVDFVLLKGEDSVTMMYFLVNIFGGKVKSYYCKILGITCKKSAKYFLISTKARLLARTDFSLNFSDVVQ